MNESRTSPDHRSIRVWVRTNGLRLAPSRGWRRGLAADHPEAFETAKTHRRARSSDPAFEFDATWQNAVDKERRVLIEELIEAVTIHADRLEVTVTRTPSILAKLDEVWLRPAGTRPVV